MLAGADDSDEDFDENGLSTEAVEGPSKIGKKKAEKMAAKAEKKVEREAMQKELEEKKKQREKDDEEARYCCGCGDLNTCLVSNSSNLSGL